MSINFIQICHVVLNSDEGLSVYCPSSWWSRLLSFKSPLFVDQITNIGNEMCVQTLIFSNFQLLEVVNRGSETQPQVAENLNKFP